MKTLFKILLLITVTQVNAQFFDRLAKKAEDAAKRTVERKVEEKSEKTTDKAVDKVLNPESKKNKENQPSDSSSKKDKKSKTAISSNDFVAGTKVLATEDFSQDAIGDFPVNWLTNSSGEVITFEGADTRWLKLNDNGNFSPINFKKFPENFTLEFDLYASDNFSFYSSSLRIIFAASSKKNDYSKWTEFQKGKEGIIIGLHPQTAGNRKIGMSGFSVVSEGTEILHNEKELTTFNQDKNIAKVQFWRQKNRLRMYINGTKVWDLPNAFQETNYNSIVFSVGGYNSSEDRYFISNIKLAEAGADTRHKLIETGTFTTNEILFDTNKATIKSSSYSVLEELGRALQENSEVKISITGHTDSDGNESDNQKLSLQRAESVKNYLASHFQIETSRMKTIGKGENVPIADNKTEDGKKMNRRVEFTVVK